MRSFQLILMHVSLVGAFVLTVCWAAIAWRRGIALVAIQLLAKWRRIGNLGRALLFTFVTAMILYGSTKTNQTNGADGGTTNPPPAMACLLLGGLQGSYGVEAVTDEDIARGYRLERVSTNAEHSFAFPTNGVLCGHWHQRGAYDDVTSVDFGDWTFPLGTSEVSRLWAFVNGSARPILRDTIHEIAPVGTPLSAIPSVSRLWMAATTNDARLVTWENFAVGRLRLSDYPLPSTNYPLLSAQIELRPDGDFVTRSNEVEIAYRRVDPNDWDGDGWHNDDDPSPKVWTDGTFGLEQSLPTNANADAYCWIDVRSAHNTHVRFVGDGPSNLPDPSFTARAGTTQRVWLLIGKRYAVTSDRPLSVVNRSSDEIEIDGDGTTELSIVWPVDLYALEGNGRGFRMIATPSCLQGRFHWTNSCCTVYGEGDVFRYGCVSNCVCTGCSARGYYAYEGYRLFAEGGSCGCSSYPGDDPNEDSPGASVSFSKSVIFLEDAYANTPTNTVPWQSTDTLLTCDANGGDNGGVVTFSIAGGTNLIQYTGQPLPYTRTLSPDETIHFVNRYKAVAESATTNDIVVTATFVENVTGWRNESEATATAVRVEVKPVVCAPANDSDDRHGFGIGEPVRCLFTPENAPVSWVSNGPGVFSHFDSEARYHCPLNQETNGFKICGLGCEYIPSTCVVEPDAVLARDASYGCQGVSPGQAGGIFLKMSLHALPLEVSFSYVKMEEVPDADGSRSGYFSDSYFMSEWYHGSEQHAGIWCTVTGDNKILEDEAGFVASLPQLDANGHVSPTGTCGWVSGLLSWEVPCGWAAMEIEDGGEPVGTFAVDQLQVMTIDSAGNCEVQKHSNGVRRTIDGHIYLNGVFVQ